MMKSDRCKQHNQPQSPYGLLGQHLGHSWSAMLHQGLGREQYALFEVRPEALEAFLSRQDLAGLNVTIPYKQTVIPYCACLDPEAAQIGSVNTMVRKEGRWLGYNTDAEGFRRLVRETGLSLSGKRILILGSGGASRTVQWVAKQSGAEKITVLSRSGPDGYDRLEAYGDAQVIINATPVGMYPDTGRALVDLRQFPHCQGVLDLIYNPQRTALLLQAQDLGLVCADGLAMLAAQARAAEELFFGQSIPESAERRLLGQLRGSRTNLVIVKSPGSADGAVIADRLGALTGRQTVDLDRAVEQQTGCQSPGSASEGAETGLPARILAEYGRQSGLILSVSAALTEGPAYLALLRQNGRIYDSGRFLSGTKGPDEAARSIWRDFCEHTGFEWPQPEPAGASGA